MRWLIKSLDIIIDWLAHAFGDLPFILGYNIMTTVWFFLGIYDKHFIDPYPNSFLTFLMSWAAINMTSFLLWSDRRKAERARRDEEHQRNTLNTLLALSEAQASMIPLIRRIAENEVMIFEIIADELAPEHQLK